jgi:hypothetical protein
VSVTRDNNAGNSQIERNGFSRFNNKKNETKPVSSLQRDFNGRGNLSGLALPCSKSDRRDSVARVELEGGYGSHDDGRV